MSPVVEAEVEQDSLEKLMHEFKDERYRLEQLEIERHNRMQGFKMIAACFFCACLGFLSSQFLQTSADNTSESQQKQSEDLNEDFFYTATIEHVSHKSE